MEVLYILIILEVINISYRKVNKENSFAKWFIDKFGIDDFNNIIIHEKNIKNGINIWEISKRSAAKLWFRCKDKYYHEYELTADKYYKGNRCKYCGRTKYIHQLDSFGQYIIDNYGIEFLNKIWSDKNENSPFEYTLGTEKKHILIVVNVVNILVNHKLKIILLVVKNVLNVEEQYLVFMKRLLNI